MTTGRQAQVSRHTDRHEQAHGQDQDRMSVASRRLHFSRPEELTVTVPVYVVGQ